MIEEDERPVFDRMDGVRLPAESRLTTGHDRAMDQLAGSHKADRLHHAWLVSGPRGIGKSTLALNFAKHLFAHPNGSAAPERFEAETISNALHGAVAQGAHNQLLHLARPWNAKTGKFMTVLPVDEVRRTVPFYGMTAGGGGHRVTIIDAADDMNTSAANAVLKMLEEPPAKSIFFVLAHSPGALLPTIRSRCRVLSLDPLSDGHIDTVLNEVCDDAGSEQERAAAARLAQGSVRRAIQLREGELLSLYGTFEAMMTQAQPGEARDWVAAHAMADKLAARGAEGTYDLFIELVLDWMATRVREGDAMPLAQRARWADLHGSTAQAVRTAAAFNLDRKQTLLNLFGNLFSVARS